MAKEKCFIIAPISTLPDRVPLYLNDSEHSEHVIDHLLVPAVEKAGFDAIKPKAKGANLIHADIVQNLQTASLVLCDMSSLNPNVFFELGVRTAMNKPVCLTIDQATENPPFDLGVINHHKYVSDLRPWVLPSEIEKLAGHIKESTSNNENALWKYFSLRLKAGETTGMGPVDKMDLLLSEINALRKQVGQAEMFSHSIRFRPNQPEFGSTAESRSRLSMAQIVHMLHDEARDRGVRVLRSDRTPDNKITFFTDPSAKEPGGILGLIGLAELLGVKLTVVPLPQ